MSYNAATSRLKLERIQTELAKADSVGQILRLVWESVNEVVGEHRQRLNLFFRDLPLNVGGYHRIDSDYVVLNERLLAYVRRAGADRLETNAFVYSILLHEYLHSLGYYNEREVRRGVLEISKLVFGNDHLVTFLAYNGPWAIFEVVHPTRLEPFFV